MSAFQRIAFLLTIIGAINWGLIIFFQVDLISGIFGGRNDELAKIIYGVIGIAGFINLGLFFKTQDGYIIETEAKRT
ncbi:DUF378 domain-containing protein [Neobacillus mesonae]|uniref:DUF378 domain-containing protein n=1 Tax=Neobacillus mesonae TaxID=1193713 RepID=UPI00203C62CC|nr:DUF378 domain-containing protein [Neobacillus mesonae]MCM3568168.1 DUF378 domain-containing protein [Neobacillus mesonae]